MTKSRRRRRTARPAMCRRQRKKMRRPVWTAQLARHRQVSTKPSREVQKRFSAKIATRPTVAMTPRPWRVPCRNKVGWQPSARQLRTRNRPATQARCGAESLSTTSAAVFPRHLQGEEPFPTADAGKESPATIRKPSTDADEVLESRGVTRTGAGPDSSSRAESWRRDTTRSTHARHAAHDQVFASSVDESRSVTRWPLRAALSPDFAALELTLQHLLANGREIGEDVTDWFTRADVSHWTLTATIALIAAEIVRRRAQRSRSNESDPAYDGADVSLRLFPELLGVPPCVRP